MTEWRIGDDRIAADPIERHQEVDAIFAVGTTAVDEIGCDDLVPGRAQHGHDVAGTARRFPNTARQSLDLQQRLDRAGRRVVGIALPFNQRMAPALTRVIEHEPTPLRLRNVAGWWQAGNLRRSLSVAQATQTRKPKKYFANCGQEYQPR